MKNKPVVITQTLENQPGAWTSKYAGRDWLGFNEFIGIADQTLMSNPTVAAGWQELLSVMAQASVGLTGEDKVPEIHAFLSEMLFSQMSRRINAVLIELLDALIYGVQPMQVITEYIYGKGWVIRDLLAVPARYFQIETASKKPGQWWVEGFVQTDNGLVECGGPGSGKALFLWATFGPGLLGRSILRPIMSYNEEKDEARRLRGVGLGKSVLGTLIAKERRPDISSGETGMNEQQLTNVSNTLASLTSPVAQASVGTVPYTIESVQPVYPAADSIGKTIETENHADLTALQAFGSQHMARGLLSGYGSQNAGDNDAKAQQALRGYYYQWLANTLQPLLDWVIDMNFEAVPFYPELHIVSPSAQEPASLINSYCRLVQAGAIQPTTADQDYIRQLLRLPERTAGQIIPLDIGKEVAGYYNQKTGMDTREPERLAEQYQARKEYENG